MRFVGIEPNQIAYNIALIVTYKFSQLTNRDIYPAYQHVMHYIIKEIDIFTIQCDTLYLKEETLIQFAISSVNVCAIQPDKKLSVRWVVLCETRF